MQDQCMPDKVYMLSCLGLLEQQAKTINAGLWSAVRRNRIFFSNTSSFKPPPVQASPWAEGWVVSQHCEDHKLMPWLRSRGITAKGHVVMTTGAYHPVNLRYDPLR